MATRSDIRRRARTRADQDSSGFPTDSQYNDIIDEAAIEVWYDLMMAGWPWDFTSKSITATGAATYAIVTTDKCASVRAVWFKQAGSYYELKRLNPGKEGQLLSVPGQGNFASFYEIRQSATLGAVVALYPVQAAGSYQVDYISEFPGFAADGDAWMGPGRSDELIVLRAAMKAARKEKDVAMELKQEYDELFKKVSASASVLDGRSPAQIRDVVTNSPRFGFDYNVAGPGGSDW